jgi:antitoxin (DNA-binding transcriptional repressor) of toxin-antitoxin stability system
MSILTVSTKELRENFSRVKAALDSGQSLLLLYRSQPLAEIKPAQKLTGLRSFSTAQLRQWIAADQLTPSQQRRADDIINRLP